MWKIINDRNPVKVKEIKDICLKEAECFDKKPQHDNLVVFSYVYSYYFDISFIVNVADYGLQK